MGRRDRILGLRSSRQLIFDGEGLVVVSAAANRQSTCERRRQRELPHYQCHCEYCT